MLRLTRASRTTFRASARSPLTPLLTSFGVVMFAMAALGPVLYEISLEFDLSFTATALLVAMQGVGRGGFMLVLGPLADRVPARRLLPLGLAITSGAALIAAAAPNIWLLAAGVMAGGVGSGLVIPSGQVHIVKTVAAAARQRAIGRVMSGGMCGAFVAPGAAGVLASQFGWRSAFLLVAAVALAATALAALARSLDTPARAGARARAAPARLPTLGVGRGVLEVALLAVLVWGWNNATRGIVLPLYGSAALNLSPRDVGAVLTIALGGRAALTFVSGNLAQRFGPSLLLLSTTIGGAVGTLLLFAPASLGVYGALAVSYTLSGLASPLVVMLLAERAPPQRIGRAMGFTQFLVDLAGLAMPLLIGLLLDITGFGAVGALLAAIYLAAAVWGMRLLRSRPSSIQDGARHT